ncbi:hypothetical protein FSARC_12169 [Fusarium sarcochroum]|uniref:Zn(2)-C6 fungal-type domain-containing protein n=1 Tax=Fusarium sarcochroum TaxID=1208366 RepID=A0A8H4WY63_9HYPO|nr:hypothetical protein FSARC_12169 [Fusarium sarcochroum]
MAVRGEGDKSDNKDTPVRQRKAHKKSRLGCKNCKLRSVKCDEAKPSCKRCVASGFVCSFTLTSSPPSSQLAHRSAGPVFSVVDKSLGPLNPGFRVPIVQPIKGGVGEIVLDDAALAAIERFRLRTVFSVGTEKTRSVYSQGAFMLGLKHPFLLHVFVALALIHDQYLDPCQTPAHRTALAFHWYQATAIFHRRLLAAVSIDDPTRLPGPERDSLWTSGALLGAASFALLDAQDVEHAWPLKASDPMDLDWLKMSDGKRVVWKIADPMRKDSVFHELLTEWDDLPNGLKPIPPDALPEVFYTVFNLGPSSSAEDNPYHVAASLLAQLLPRKVDNNTVVQFLTFLTQLDPRFRKFLEEKEPKAMVLLAWWYSKAVEHKSWWMHKRSLIEGQAICIYLERYYMHIEGIRELIQLPKRVFDSCKNGGVIATGYKTVLATGVQVY